jgi:hypothetical protein
MIATLALDRTGDSTSTVDIVDEPEEAVTNTVLLDH